MKTTSIRNHGIATPLVAGVILLTSLGCTNSSLKPLFRPDAPELAESAPLTPWHDSFEAALQESEATGKPIIADFTGSDWCSWCVKLRNDVFETQVFNEWARDNVVLLELDYPKRAMQKPEIKRQNAELADQYNVNSYPTVLLLDSTGQVLGKMGYMNNPTEWIQTADAHLGFVAETADR